MKLSIRGSAALLASLLFTWAVFYWQTRSVVLSSGAGLFCIGGAAFILMLEQEKRAEEAWAEVRFLLEDDICTAQDLNTAVEHAQLVSKFYF